MKGFIKIMVFALVLLSIVSCAKEEEVTLTVWTQRIGAEGEALEAACEAFTKETGIKVEFNAPGTDYENLLRMKMSANEMPDIWSTHGWAVNRYSEYLADLSNQAWVDRISPSLLAQVTTADGKVVAMPIDSSVNAIGYNPAIFEEYGLETPKTVEELYAVCEAILEKSNGTVVPMHIGGGDVFPIAKMHNWMSTTGVTLASNDHSAELVDGSFDWENYKIIGEFTQTIHENGYLNVDVLTATNDDTSKAMASGTAAMAFTGWNIRPAVLTYNPEAEFGFFPIPTFSSEDAPIVVGGETDSWGVSKNTENMDAAIKFLEYFARADVNKALCEELQIQSGFMDVQADLGEMTPYFENVSTLDVEPFFDRTFFPSGMWDGMQRYGQMLLTEGYTVDQYVSDMESEYNNLRSK